MRLVSLGLTLSLMCACRARPPAPAPQGDAAAREKVERLAGQGERCAPDGTCPTGLECLTYYGVAGTAGPKFTSCEIRCTSDANCPPGQVCAHIVDGPGAVCRPPER